MSLLAIQGAGLFAFIPIVLFLFLQLPLGPGPSLALGSAIMLGHRFAAAPWMARHSRERCLWCGARVGPSCEPIEVRAGGRAWPMMACGAPHRLRIERFLAFVNRFRVAIAIGIFVPLALLLGGTLALALGHPFVAHGWNRFQFRLIVAATVVGVSVGYLAGRPREGEPVRCPFPLHNLFLLGIGNTLWVFRAVGAVWIALSILALASGTAGAAAPPSAPGTERSDPSAASSERAREISALLEETNSVRTERGLAALALSSALSAPAQAHAEDMLDRGYFSHVSPSRKGPAERIRIHSPRAIVLEVRENITKTEGELGEGVSARAHEVIDGWVRSKPHRENLYCTDCAQVGFGVAAKGRGNKRVEYTVQVLGSVAGEWERSPEAKIATPAAWSLRLDSPLEFFLEDASRPKRPYPAGDGSSRIWIGGLPLVVSVEGAHLTLRFPRLDPGRFELMARRPGAEGWQELREITVEP